MENYTKGLADFCSQLNFEALPQRIVERTKWLILDNLGVILGATVLDFGKEIGRKRPSLGSGLSPLPGMPPLSMVPSRRPLRCRTDIPREGITPPVERSQRLWLWPSGRKRAERISSRQSWQVTRPETGWQRPFIPPIFREDSSRRERREQWGPRPRRQGSSDWIEKRPIKPWE
jgi:hypothetical protein